MSASAMAVAEETVVMLDVNKIRPNRYQPRKKFDPEKIEELAASIKEDGLLEPIIVREIEKGQWELLMGNRRLLAHEFLNRPQIKSIVKEVTEKEARRMALVENIQREDLTPIEEALAFQLLLPDYDDDVDQMSESTGKKSQYITDRLALLTLPEQIQTYIDEGKLNLSHAEVLLALPAEKQLPTAERAVRYGLSPNQLKGSMQQDLGGGKGGSGAGSSEKAMTYNRLSSQIIDLYDGLETYDFAMLKDAEKKGTLKKQLNLLRAQIDEGITKLDSV